MIYQAARGIVSAKVVTDFAVACWESPNEQRLRMRWWMSPISKRLSAVRIPLGLPHGSMSAPSVLLHSILYNFIFLVYASGGCSRPVPQTWVFQEFYYFYWFLKDYMTPNGGHKNIAFYKVFDDSRVSFARRTDTRARATWYITLVESSISLVIK